MPGLLPGGLKRTDELAGLQFLRKQDHLFARVAELLDVLVHDAAELRHQRRSFLPLAVRRKRDRADDGFELVAVEISSNRLLVKRPRSLDSLPDKSTAV